MPSSAESSRRVRALAVVLVLGLELPRCSQADPAPPDRSQPSVEPSPGTTAPAVEPSVDDVADLLDAALVVGSRAHVRIESAPGFTFEGTARFRGAGPDPRSLIGRVDFRSSDEDSAYSASEGQVRVRVPAGVEFPPASTTTQLNQWGPAMVRIDPGVVAVAVETDGRDVVAGVTADGGRTFRVTLDGPAALVNFGFPASPDLPETIRYEIELDAQQRLTRIRADFDRYGDDIVSFDEWR